MWDKTVAWLLGLEEVDLVRIEDFGLGAAWAQGNGFFWVVMACICLGVIAVMFYLKFQSRGSAGARTGMAVCRGLLLMLLLITLADPVVRLYEESFPKPLVYVLFDGTESMAIEDDLPAEQRDALAAAVGIDTQQQEKTNTASRLTYVKALVGKEESNLLQRLQEEKKYRIEAFTFSGTSNNQLRRLELAEEGSELDPQHLAEQLAADGQVTAIGTVIDDLNHQLGKGNLAGVVMFSDYGSNSGIAPVGSDEGRRTSPVTRLNVPIHTVGIGATEAVDLKIDVRPDIKMKRAERANVAVEWEQSGLSGKSVTVYVTARPIHTDLGESTEEIVVGQETVTLDSTTGYVQLPFTPEQAGRFEFKAWADGQDAEANEQNNTSKREVNVIDDHLRLMYVAYEPNWEWRFVKEVFHRDKLVGMKGFRTFLRSSDPKIRQYNDLFLPTLAPKRSEFFENDIIFLGDMPNSAISSSFADMTREFVGDFGGGLVVIAGPRFGPTELVGTPLADMLPVKVETGLQIRDRGEFRLQLTPEATSTEFMQLGGTGDDEERDRLAMGEAWRNLGELHWYQPVTSVDPKAYVLAEHPSDVCSDGKTPQPLIAIKKYGKGEVVYIAFDEMWRLRRRHGEKFYRQFWSQLMNRLALRNALGSQKRFVVETNQKKYRIDDRVRLTVNAYDENYEKLTADKLPEKALEAEVIAPSEAGGDRSWPIQLTQHKPGVFEAYLPAAVEGEYRVRVKDPIEDDHTEARFRVESVSAERLRPERNVVMQERIARESGGKSYDLTTVDNLVDDLNLTAQPKKNRRNKQLWATPLWFILVIGLMLGEWFSRKMMHLA